MTTIVYILVAILIFGILIAVHELGHFLAAKACGVTRQRILHRHGAHVVEKAEGRDAVRPAGHAPAAASAPWRGRTRTPTIPTPCTGRASGPSW